jgi:hypothetical protein
MTVSGATCAVVGGHLLEGTAVRTTAEIVLAEVEGVAFERPNDVRTGYAELSIVETTPPRTSTDQRSAQAVVQSGGTARWEVPMRAALEQARLAIVAHNHPFGAVLCLDGEVVLSAQNTVMSDGDPTCHAELNLISQVIPSHCWETDTRVRSRHA